MAQAPTPGSTAPEKKQSKLRITMKGRTLELDFGQLGPGDDLIARQETGFPVSSFVDAMRFASDSLLILWWMARRKNGEPRLRFSEVLGEFPTNDAIVDAEPDADWLNDAQVIDALAIEADRPEV